MAPFDYVNHPDDIMPPALMYFERFHNSDKDYHCFWEPIWQKKGFAPSFYSEFLWAIHLPSALDASNYFNCCAHMQYIFQSVMHLAWVMVAFRVVQDIRLEQRVVVSNIGRPIGRRVRLTPYFDQVRRVIQNFNLLRFEEIPVRREPVSASTRKRTKRPQSALSAQITSFRVVKPRFDSELERQQVVTRRG